MQVQVIRGYKLFLWAKRLGIPESYAKDELMVSTIYFVHSIIPVDDLTSKVILLADRPIIFEALNSTINLLLEKFEIEE